MRILLLHNRYRQPGGEDGVFAAETDLLRAGGHHVVPVAFDNDGGWMELTLGAAWSRSSYRRVLELCRSYQPDVAHVHNFWMRLSPSVHSACQAAGVAAVQTLHNYRLACVNAGLLRNGRNCEDCLGGLPWRGVTRRCYRGSLAASAAVAGMVMFNRARGTWTSDVNAFIVPSENMRRRLAGAGVPAERMFVKPNFTADPGEPAQPPSASCQVVYAGRLSQEKGAGGLLEAWAASEVLRTAGAQLVIAGDGPERTALERLCASHGLAEPQVTFAGQLERPQLQALLRTCRCVAVPSVWQEPFGLIAIEGFAHGRPVIASRMGALEEIVQHDRNGLLVDAQRRAELVSALEAMLTRPEAADAMGETARRTYLQRYTPERNLPLLTSIYRHAIEAKRRMEAPLARAAHQSEVKP